MRIKPKASVTAARCAFVVTSVTLLRWLVVAASQQQALLPMPQICVRFRIRCTGEPVLY